MNRDLIGTAGGWLLALLGASIAASTAGLASFLAANPGFTAPDNAYTVLSDLGTFLQGLAMLTLLVMVMSAVPALLVSALPEGLGMRPSYLLYGLAGTGIPALWLVLDRGPDGISWEGFLQSSVQFGWTLYIAGLAGGLTMAFLRRRQLRPKS